QRKLSGGGELPEVGGVMVVELPAVGVVAVVELVSSGQQL
ncbi:hypothetical protein A2U01_0062985, partial [Trifolium medium]|nr:hypothetical protein [Trifolium medium]